MKLPNVPSHANHFNICLVVLLVSFFVLSSRAMAEGMYVAVDVGKSKNYCVSCSGYDNAYRFGGGYQFSPIFGVEANYGNFPTSHWSVSGGGVTLDGSTKNSIIQVDATATIPFANAFFVIGKLGIAKTKYLVGASITKETYGVGVQYDLSRRFAVRAQYEEFASSFSLISAGVMMKF